MIGIMNVISKFIRATWSTVHISVKYRDKHNFWSPETNLGPSTGSVYESIVPKINCLLKDRPFYLKVGGYGFLFRSEFFFRTTQARNFFPEFNIRLYDKYSESDFFFPPPKSEYFFQQHWESEYFFRKKTTPLQVKWSFPKHW